MGMYISLIGERKSVHENFIKMRREEGNALAEVGIDGRLV